MMTSQDFQALAAELRAVYPEPGGTHATDLGSDWYAGKVRGWENAVLAIARACSAANPRWQSPRFFAASGLQRRPDGSMYPVIGGDRVR
jgi:hypothetical protein